MENKRVDNFSTWVMTGSTVLMAIAAIFSYIATNNLINEQKREEVTKDRAYLSINADTLTNNFTNDKNQQKELAFSIKNDGVTPAQSSSVMLVPFLNGQPGNSIPIGTPQTFFAPGEALTAYTPLPNEDIGLMRDSSQNYIEIQVQYFDYFGNKHLLIQDLQTHYTDTSTFLNALVIKNEYEVY
jgi:hypothetical protein